MGEQNPNNEPNNEPATDKTFTQEQVNSMVSAEKKDLLSKYGVETPEELATKFETMGKTISDYKLKDIKAEKMKDAKIDPEFAEYIKGDNAEEIEASAKSFAEILRKKNIDTPTPDVNPEKKFEPDDKDLGELLLDEMKGRTK